MPDEAEINKWLISEFSRLDVGKQIGTFSDGEYTVRNLSSMDVTDDRLWVINYLIINLRKDFPDFVFWKVEKLFAGPDDGMTIRWAKKIEGLSSEESYRQTIDAQYAADDKANLELEAPEEQPIKKEYVMKRAFEIDVYEEAHYLTTVSFKKAWQAFFFHKLLNKSNWHNGSKAS